jgi:hypothetical protein
MRHDPPRSTLNALRATRDAQRLATAVRCDRITAMGTVACARCGRPVAVATDAAHPPSKFEGRVVCGACLKSEKIWDKINRNTPDPPEQSFHGPLWQLEELVNEGYLIVPPAPDPRPTWAQWFRSLWRRQT